MKYVGLTSVDRCLTTKIPDQGRRLQVSVQLVMHLHAIQELLEDISGVV